MQIELRKDLALPPGTFNAVIASEKMMITAINRNADLQRFLFLYVGGNYSRILSGVKEKIFMYFSGSGMAHCCQEW